MAFPTTNATCGGDSAAPTGLSYSSSLTHGLRRGLHILRPQRGRESLGKGHRLGGLDAECALLRLGQVGAFQRFIPLSREERGACDGTESLRFKQAVLCLLLRLDDSSLADVQRLQAERGQFLDRSSENDGRGAGLPPRTSGPGQSVPIPG